MMSDLVGMSKVKADDMDAIGQSGAANLLRMNGDRIEELERSIDFARRAYDAGESRADIIAALGEE